MSVGNRRCGTGYSTTVQHAIIDAVVAHGVHIRGDDERLRSNDTWCANQNYWQLGDWTVRSWETFRRDSRWRWEDWEHEDRSIFHLFNERLEDSVCGQCAECTMPLTMRALHRTLDLISKREREEQDDDMYDYEPWENSESQQMRLSLQHSFIDLIRTGEYGQLTEMAKLL